MGSVGQIMNDRLCQYARHGASTLVAILVFLGITVAEDGGFELSCC